METAKEPATSAPRWTQTVNVTAVGFCVAVGVFGVISILGLDYSDAEIQASLVDTWEAAAWSSYLLLAVVVLIALASLAFAKASVGIHRGKLLFTATLAIVAFVLEFAGMLVLTRRAELLESSNLSSLLYFF